MFFILNDNLPDGRDVSWIYDIQPEKLAKACENKKIFVGGTRYLDMAIRLNYAGINDLHEDTLSTNLKLIIDEIVGSEKILDVLILPNYSSMLEVRELLIGRKIL